MYSSIVIVLMSGNLYCSFVDTAVVGYVVCFKTSCTVTNGQYIVCTVVNSGWLGGCVGAFLYNCHCDLFFSVFL